PSNNVASQSVRLAFQASVNNRGISSGVVAFFHRAFLPKAKEHKFLPFVKLMLDRMKDYTNFPQSCLSSHRKEDTAHVHEQIFRGPDYTIGMWCQCTGAGNR